MWGRILWRILRRLFELLFSPQMQRRVHRHIREIESVIEHECEGRTFRVRLGKYHSWRASL